MTAIDLALETTRSLVQGDGYDVRLDGFEAGELRLTILAGPGACEECLVPKEMLAEIIASTLPAELAGACIVLTYPNEAS